MLFCFPIPYHSKRRNGPLFINTNCSVFIVPHNICAELLRNIAYRHKCAVIHYFRSSHSIRKRLANYNAYRLSAPCHRDGFSCLVPAYLGVKRFSYRSQRKHYPVFADKRSDIVGFSASVYVVLAVSYFKLNSD